MKITNRNGDYIKNTYRKRTDADFLHIVLSPVGNTDHITEFELT